MYERILVAVDGSNTSNLALAEAISLAKIHHALLRLVHVIDPIMTYTVGWSPRMVPVDFVECERAMKAAGEKVIADCSATVREAGVRCEAALLAIEKPGQRICDVIEEEVNRWPADVIVVGTHGRRGVRRFFLGSVAQDLTRIAGKPVLLVRADKAQDAA
jgi:nucleotide-binding universal stress UspA family protein